MCGKVLFETFEVYGWVSTNGLHCKTLLTIIQGHLYLYVLYSLKIIIDRNVMVTALHAFATNDDPTWQWPVCRPDSGYEIGLRQSLKLQKETLQDPDARPARSIILTFTAGGGVWLGRAPPHVEAVESCPPKSPLWRYIFHNVGHERWTRPDAVTSRSSFHLPDDVGWEQCQTVKDPIKANRKPPEANGCRISISDAPDQSAPSRFRPIQLDTHLKIRNKLIILVIAFVC